MLLNVVVHCGTLCHTEVTLYNARAKCFLWESVYAYVCECVWACVFKRPSRSSTQLEETTEFDISTVNISCYFSVAAGQLAGMQGELWLSVCVLISVGQHTTYHRSPGKRRKHLDTHRHTHSLMGIHSINTPNLTYIFIPDCIFICVCVCVCVQQYIFGCSIKYDIWNMCMCIFQCSVKMYCVILCNKSL